MCPPSRRGTVTKLVRSIEGASRAAVVFELFELLELLPQPAKAAAAIVNARALARTRATRTAPEYTSRRPRRSANWEAAKVMDIM